MRSLMRLIKNYRNIVSIKNNRIPVYFTDKYEPCFRLERGPFSNKIAVMSIPKSGTYMLGKTLEELGYVDSQIHVNVAGYIFTDYRFISMEEARYNFEKYVKRLDLKYLTRMVLPGQYFLSHLNKSRKYELILKNYKKIFVYRNLKDCMVSFLRYIEKNNRYMPNKSKWVNKTDLREKMFNFIKYEGNKIREEFNCVCKWRESDGVYLVKYEDFIGDNGEKAADKLFEALLTYLNLDANNVDINGLRNKVLNQDTQTRSSSRTDISEYWDDRVEQVFADIGFSKLNDFLGYKS